MQKKVIKIQKMSYMYEIYDILILNYNLVAKGRMWHIRQFQTDFN
jgi:hypothetical protein